MNYIVTNIAKLTNIFTEIKNELNNNPNSIYNLSWEKSHRSKTLAQLGFFWAGLVKAINKHFENYYGKEYDPEIIKEMLYSECSTTEEFICPNGKILYQQKRISKMSVKEMSEFIEKVINFCDEYHIILQPELRYLWVNNLSPVYIEEISQAKYPEKDPEYLSYVRNSHCIICGKSGCEAHHYKHHSLCGLGKKSPDWTALEICHNCHTGNGHITSEYIDKCISHLHKGIDIITFLKLRYERYIKHL